GEGAQRGRHALELREHPRGLAVLAALERRVVEAEEGRAPPAPLAPGRRRRRGHALGDDVTGLAEHRAERAQPLVALWGVGSEHGYFGSAKCTAQAPFSSQPPAAISRPAIA